MNVDTAYRYCETVTRREARNFSYGIRLLAPARRRALSAVYAFARRVDDIGDGDLPPEKKLDELAHVRTQIREVEERPDDPVLVALAHASRRLPIPLHAFEELIDGCEADVRGTRYATFDDLVHYCRCVAGSIGRLSLGVFDTSAEREVAQPLADTLGVALQLTNILRDLREDRANGRVYLPSADLERFGCTLQANAEGEFTDPPEDLAALVRFEAARAQEWYRKGLLLAPMLDRRSAACVRAMAGIYHSLLRRIIAEPGVAVRTRVSLPSWEKALVAFRALAGASV